MRYVRAGARATAFLRRQSAFRAAPGQPGGATSAKRAIANLLAILEAAGSSPRCLLKVTAYVVGVENWPRFNAVYASMLGAALPARSVVPVPELHYGYLIEIDAVAVVDDE